MAEESKSTVPYKGQDADWNSAERKGRRQKAAQKRIKGDIRYSKATISDKKRKAVGGYDVAPGGGSPYMKKSKRGVMNKNFYVAEDAEEAKELRKEHPKAWIRTLQKRNKDGTYGRNFDNGRDPLENSSKGKAGTTPETYEGKEDVKLKKGDTILDKGERYVILKNTTYSEFMEMTEEYRKLYIAKKKGRKSGLEKGLGKQSGILTYDEKSKKKGYFMSGEQMLKEAVQYKKKKGKKGKVIRKDWVRKNPKTPESPKQPENKPTQPEAPKQPEQEKGSFDATVAKNNPVRFAAENKEKLDYLQAMAKGKGKTIKQSILISEIASGKYKSWEELENLIRSKL